MLIVCLQRREPEVGKSQARIMEIEPDSVQFEAMLDTWWGVLTKDQMRWKLLASPYGPAWGLCALYEDEVAAMLVIGRTRTQWNDHIWDSGAIYQTFTAPAFRGRGLMSQLVAYAVSHGQSRGFQMISALPNVESRGIYAKAGFAHVGFLRRWVAPNYSSFLPALREIRTGNLCTSRPAADRAPTYSSFSDQIPLARGCIHSVRTGDFLNWRFGGHPQSAYRIVTTEDYVAYCREGRRGELSELQVLGISAHNARAAMTALRSARSSYRGLVSFAVSDGRWNGKLMAAGFIPTRRGSPIHLAVLDPEIPRRMDSGLFLDGIDGHTA